MKIEEDKIVSICKEVQVGCECDICGKVENDSNVYDNWFEGDIHHSEWGNDSVDSYEYFDICSGECCITALGRCLKDMRSYRRSAKIFGMSYDFAESLYKSISSSSISLK